MKKGLIGFLIGLIIIVVGFVSTVLVMASVNDRTFTGEIKSWFEDEKVVEIPEDELPEVNDGDESETDEGVETEPTAIITI